MPRVTARNKPPERPSRLKILLRRQRRNLRFVVLGLFGFGAVLATIGVFHTTGVGSSLFGWRERLGRAMNLRVAHIVIEGRHNMPEDRLLADLGIHEGSLLFGRSVEDARVQIEKEPWVDHVAVERRLPDTITVDLTERRPFAIWQIDGQFRLIDRDGQVVTGERVETFKDLPLVVGAGAPPHAAVLLDTLDAYTDIKARVDAVVRVGERRWNLALRNGTVVMLPEAHEDAALARLAALQRDDEILDRPLVFVDLRLPDRLALRAKPVAAPSGEPLAPLAPASPASGLNRRAT